jgi:hypothetical protein
MKEVGYGGIARTYLGPSRADYARRTAMTCLSSRAFRPRLESLESLKLPSASPVLIAVAPITPNINLKSTPIAVDAKTYVAASTPSSGRRGGIVDFLTANAATRTVTGSLSISYHTRLLPSYLSLFSPYVTFNMRVYFTTSLDYPNPGDVKISFSKNVVPFGGDLRDKAAHGVAAFIRHDHDQIAALLAH